MPSVTHPAASHQAPIRRLLPALAALAVLALAGCGSQRSTLPPSPNGAGVVALGDLAQHPEVYADASVVTTGTVRRARGARKPLFVLDGGHGTRIVLEPSSSAAGDLGERVRVSGLFTVTFKLGYEILVSRIAPAASL
jgi:hypothetical protein